MWPVSAAFKDAITNGGNWTVEGDVLQKGVLVRADVPIIDGTFSVDKFASIRRRTSLVISAEDPTWVPRTASDPLFPAGNELQLRAGFEFSDGSRELVPCGLYRISRPKVSDDGENLIVSMDGYDRSRAVSRMKFLRPYVVHKGTPFPEAIKALIQIAFPWIPDEDYLFLETEESPTYRLIFDVNDDPWQKATQIAAHRGCEVFFDPEGKPVLQEEPDPSWASPVWEYVEGETATILDINRDLDDQEAYNGWVVLGRNSANGTPPVRAVAWDTDISSPTYFDPERPEQSVYGRVPTTTQSDNITTKEEAQVVANAQRRRNTGILEQVDFSAIPNPAHEGGDVIKLTRERAGVSNAVNVMDGIGVPLGLGGRMTVNTRQRRALSES